MMLSSLNVTLNFPWNCQQWIIIIEIISIWLWTNYIQSHQSEMMYRCEKLKQKIIYLMLEIARSTQQNTCTVAVGWLQTVWMNVSYGACKRFVYLFGLFVWLRLRIQVCDDRVDKTLRKQFSVWMLYRIGTAVFSVHCIYCTYTLPITDTRCEILIVVFIEPYALFVY